MERVVITEQGVVQSSEGLPPEGEMAIPQSWQLGGLEDFNGVVRFTRSFTADAPPDERTFLRFQGVDYEATVRLNGVELGTHTGYFQAFEYEVTDVLRPHNELEVLVSCPREDEKTLWPDRKVLVKGVFNHHDARPGGWHPQDGQSQATGGIWGSVTLEFRPAYFVKSVQVQTVLLENDMAFVEAQVVVDANCRITADLSLEIADVTHTEKVHLQAGSSTYSLVVQLKNPELWWTWDFGTPHLYEACVRLDAASHHEVVVRTGLRTIRYEESTGTWFLNGKRIFLRGTNVIPTQWLSNYTEDVIAQDIGLLCDANINAVRVHAHINRQEFYDACDAAGILVWQDFPLQWSYLERNDVLSTVTAQIREMVHQFYNHPAIFTWCCHNEPSTNAKSMDELLVQTVRGLDGTRYIHQQSDFKEHPYWGWYLDDYKAFRATPMGPLVTEFGAQAFPNRAVMDTITTDIADWKRLTYHNFQWDETVNVARINLNGTMDEVIEASQAYQAEMLKFIIESYRREKYERVGALFQFMFMDGWPAITWSVVDVNRSPKQGYGALQAAYQPVLPILVIPRKRWLPGRTLSIPMWVVNDRQEQYADVAVEARLTRDDSVTVIDTQMVTIPQDSCVEVNPVKFSVPLDIEPGEYRLDLAVRLKSGEILGRNDYALTFSEPAPNPYDGPTEVLNS